MAKISMTELSEMVRGKLKDKGLSESDINEEIVRTISEKVRNIANEDFRAKTVPAEAEEETIDVDVSAEEVPVETPGEEPEAVTQTVEVGGAGSEDLARREGEIAERERGLAAKEEALMAKEEELNRKLADAAYQPELPREIENIGPEKLFVFDMSKLSAGAENLSKLPMKLVDSPEEETTMKDLWVNKAKKAAEVYVVKFEKVGNVEFDPFEGTSNYMTIKDLEGDKELGELQQDNDTEVGLKTGDVEHIPDERPQPGNMKDSIEPVKDVSQPLTGDMGLKAEDPAYLENLIKKLIAQGKININA